MSNLVHKLMEDYAHKPGERQGIEAAMNKHIQNVSGSYTAGARAAGMELGLHLFTNYPKEEATAMLTKSMKGWQDIQNNRRKSNGRRP